MTFEQSIIMLDKLLDAAASSLILIYGVAILHKTAKMFLSLM